MFDDIVPSQHDPPTWKLRLSLRENADSGALQFAARIISSYLSPNQYSRSVINDKNVVYTIKSIDWVVDRSIAYTVREETLNNLRVTWEGASWQELP